MSLGVTIGKFYPFHVGHDHLIREAKTRVDHLVVIVGYRPDQDLSVELRESWIRTMHPDVEILPALEDIPNEPDAWAERTLELLSGRRPDFAFTSEAYGQAWADAMGARNVVVDLHRERLPISGTQLRQNLGAHWACLVPPAKAYFAKRVCVLGVESSGTTTLARGLAQHYQTVWVPEYGRWYWEGRRYTPLAHRWEHEEFARIARGQLRWERDLAPRANKVVILDTDPLATLIWERRYMGVTSPEMETLAYEKDCDLYILTEPDSPFVQDGTRESERLRGEMHAWFLEALSRFEDGRVLRVTGSRENRFRDAVTLIDRALEFSPLPEP